MKLIWNARAQQDLAESARYIAKDNPSAAQRWLSRIRERAKQPLNFPFMGRIVPERNQENLRELVEGNYRIVYQVQADAIEIKMVFESHRLLPPIPE